MNASVDTTASAHGAQVVSAYRVAEGLKPVTVLASLQAPAESKARDMATRDYAAHDDPPGAPDAPAGRSWSTRDLAYGYQGALGEIIAWGTSYRQDTTQVVEPMTPEDALKAWISGGPNEGHYQILHIADYNAVGYAVANDASGSAFHIAVFGINPVPVKPPPGPVTPPPVPQPTPPAPKSVWRAKRNPVAKPVPPVTVIGTATGVVTFENRKGVIGHMTVAAFLRKYTQIS